ncbi:3-dehydroquinate synthase [Colwellia sp. M166]|uniref:AroB-related putative sugar phosphate phospholyase (cyclizing) n=1 Tax=Colwellia sp. M166 TaxID=2583805 RepID=UPI00211EC2D1|nr:AroB-related putative sugar phosphate phospholyase (cyclizing) [Colwellia sp. M166]UUO23118.1 3-dehydroquinate synthase [Colwellia sp. M166]|tara:strand:- start:22633 stop:23715 length:1083 start_codon:yes stop_codon:yes gene_type:complete
MKSLAIASKIHDYNVSFIDDLTPLINLIKDEKTVFVCDKNLQQHFVELNNIPAERCYFIDAIEENKNIDSVLELYRFLLGFPFKRNLHLVSIGGGIIQDISGFVASTLYRGIHWSFFPTTLLAQADSCVGSKTSLNFDHYKNILGSFYPPHQIFICGNFLATLAEDDINSGIGEIVKFLMLDDINTVSVDRIAQLAEELKHNKQYLPAIYQSLAVKQSYIKQDEFDLGKRNLFNYGHCFGHALEASSHYKVPHGIAVIIGMVFANTVSLLRGSISKEFYQHINQRLYFPYISVNLLVSYFDQEALLLALKSDKKRIGDDLVMIMLNNEQFGAEKVTNLTVLEFERAHHYFLTQMQKFISK